MSVTNIKQLAIKAKKRLKMQECGYKESYIEISRENKRRKESYLAQYTLKKIPQENKELKIKINELLHSKNAKANPLWQLIDQNYFCSLDSVSKTRYIINLSKIYRDELSFYEKKLG